MTSLTLSAKRDVKSYFEEISSFDLFYQLVYMSTTSAAGVSRSRVFQLARELPCPPSRFFKSIHEVAEHLRYNYPDAVRLVGETVTMEDIKTFLLRLSDALRSGEPLAGFLAREADVQGDKFSNDYARGIESLKKWNDAYTAVTVSVVLVVIINMVSTMIYNLGVGTMMMMVMVAMMASFGVAWVLFRSAPQETTAVPLKLGSRDQRLARQLAMILTPLMALAALAMLALGVDKGWALIAAALFLLPTGWMANRADNAVFAKDLEVSSFLRSIGGTATSRGTTLKEALASMKIDSFPALERDIRQLDLRLKSFIKPGLCWAQFGFETGSNLAKQAVGVFYEAVNLGGDPERTGNMTSAFALRTAMLRSQRRAVAATFSGLLIVMHGILAALMVFLLGILQQFAVKLNEAMAGLSQGTNASAAMGLQNMFSFNAPQIQFLTTVTVGMIIFLAFVNAFAIVASEGAHLIKITFYLAILFFLSGLCFLVVPSLVKLVM